MGSRFSSVEEVASRLEATGYLPDPTIAAVAFLADRLDKPILAEGPAGVGKTGLALALAQATGSRLLRLQCYEGLDEAKALYEWNYKKQAPAHPGRPAPDRLGGSGGRHLHRVVPAGAAVAGGDPVHRAGGAAGRRGRPGRGRDRGAAAGGARQLPGVHPGAGHHRRDRRSLVVLTSNATRELSEALRRRYLYLPVEYPSLDREREIVRARVPDLDESLAGQVARVVAWLRSIDWARTLVVLGAHTRTRRPSSRPSRLSSNISGTWSRPGRSSAAVRGSAQDSPWPAQEIS